MDQSPSRGIGRQKTATVIFNRECPKVVDRFRSGDTPVKWFSNFTGRADLRMFTQMFFFFLTQRHRDLIILNK